MRPRRFRRCGWTLVEMLLAVAIGGGIVSTAATVSVQTLAAQRAVQEKLEKRWSREQVFHAFEHDVATRIRDLPGEARGVAPLLEPGGLVEITCLTEAADAQLAFPRALPAVVRWRLKPDERTGLAVLVREVRFLTDPPERASSVVVGPPLQAARMEFLVGEEWTAAVKPDDRRTIRALRLICQWNESGDRQVRTVLLQESAAGEGES